MLAIFSESGDSWNPAPGNKLYEREAALCRRMEEARAEYEAVVDQTNVIQQDILGAQLPQVCVNVCVCCVCVRERESCAFYIMQVLENLRNVAENMLAVINNTLKCFSNMQHLLLHGEKEKVTLGL